MEDINLFEEYYGDYYSGGYSSKSIDEELAIKRMRNKKQETRGPDGVKNKTPEVLTGFWGEIIKEDIIDYPPVPEPPKMPEPPPPRFVRM